MIKQAAIFVDGEIWTLPRPARHHNIIMAINDVRKTAGETIIRAHGEQGFIDDSGVFLDRKQARSHAELCDQLTKPLIAPPNLFSEDLW